MKVVIPFIPGALHPQTQQFGEEVGAHFVNLERDRSYGYFKLLQHLWSKQEDVVLVEEDVLPTVELVQEMWACPSPECSAVFRDYFVPEVFEPRMRGAQMGCIKFSSELMAELPDVLSCSPIDYPSLDVYLIGNPYPSRVMVDPVGVGVLGRSPHFHGPALHLTAYRQGLMTVAPWASQESYTVNRPGWFHHVDEYIEAS